MRVFYIVSATLALAACSGSDAATTTSSAPGSRVFAVSAFDSVALEGVDNVRVVTGATAGVSATGPESELAKLDIRVDGSTLKIGRKRGNWGVSWSMGNAVTVTVTTPGIKAASIGGSGNMTVDRARGDSFEGSIGGSGDLDVGDVQVKRAEFAIAGSGSVKARGVAEEASYSVAGSGDVDAANFVSGTAEVSIAGSGDVRAGAKGRGKISIIGSGSATLKGTRDCEVSKLGSGDGRCEG